jgi:hypothetical protein
MVEAAALLTLLRHARPQGGAHERPAIPDLPRIKIALLGAGNMGTALAHVLAANGHNANQAWGQVDGLQPAGRA